MHIPSQPRPASINDDPEFGDRFWYWYGASGRRYIHSVYPARHCPVLPGAVYISVQRLSARQFLPLAVEVSNPLSQLASRFNAAHGADEVHVHMLAEGDQHATRICDDLRAALFDEVVVDVVSSTCALPELQYSLLAGVGATPA